MPDFLHQSFTETDGSYKNTSFYNFLITAASSHSTMRPVSNYVEMFLKIVDDVQVCSHRKLPVVQGSRWTQKEMSGHWHRGEDAITMLTKVGILKYRYSFWHFSTYHYTAVKVCIIHLICLSTQTFVCASVGFLYPYLVVQLTTTCTYQFKSKSLINKNTYPHKYTDQMKWQNLYINWHDNKTQEHWYYIFSG